MAEVQQQFAAFDSKAMIADQLKKKNTVKGKDGESIEVGGIIRYNERKRVEIIKATGISNPDGTVQQLYKVGQIINPHKIMGEALIKQGIAKEAK
jgi:hypothetical protein